MDILDNGHIYTYVDDVLNEKIILKFVKRSGGAVTYDKEWSGIQTQAVMRAIIDYLSTIDDYDYLVKKYDLFQLGDDHLFELSISGIISIINLLSILIDRSIYLNNIIKCNETRDAIYYLEETRDILTNHSSKDEHLQLLENCIENVKLSLWFYEARAYRRKCQKLNRQKPIHDDTARLKGWRYNAADDVPFSHTDIDDYPIGNDGHIVINQFL